MSTGKFKAKVESHTIDEGDTVAMRIHPHGSSEDIDGLEYDSDHFASFVIGEVTEGPTESERQMLENDHTPMMDITVETDDGEVFTWNVDNGYVIGHHPGLGRRSDVGKFGGFFDPDEL